ncbi:MAG TPA: hypothetical protein VJH24_00210 [Candidatus Bilamarchaeaceae archaeon]|nr:hypothetical protein [Candidatus Bilamarchaeaceae archaeon]
MLVDYLEENSEKLQQLHVRLRELDRQYRAFYDRNLREEISLVKNTIGKKRAEIGDYLFRHLHELRMLKNFFPDFFNVLLEDEDVGPLIRRKEWLLNVRPMKPEEAEKELKKIKSQRKQLREAKTFLKKWVGKTEARSLGATWPVLKPCIQDGMEKEEAIQALREMDTKLRKEGWLICIHEPYLLEVLDRFLGNVQQAQVAEAAAQKKYQQAKGQGSTTEYNALRNLRKAQKTHRHWKRLCTQLLYINPLLLTRLKKGQYRWKNRLREPVLRILLTGIISPRVVEKKWMDEMKKRLE